MDVSGPHNRMEKDLLLKSSRELILKWVRVNFNAYLEALDEHLFKLAKKSDNNDDQQRYFHTRNMLKNSQSNLQQHYLKYINQAFDHYLQGKQTICDYNADPTILMSQDKNSHNLSLLDNNELEEKLAINSMSQKADNNCSEMLYAFNQRLAVLSNGSNISDQSNPIAPAVFGEGLQKVIADLTLDGRSNLLIYKVFDSVFMGKIAKLYQLVNHHFESNGLLPNLNYRIQKPNSAQTAEPLTQALKSQTNKTSLANQVDLINAIRLLQTKLHAQANAPLLAETHSIPTTQLVANIEQLQHDAGCLLEALKSPEALADTDYSQIKQQTEEEIKTANDVDAKTIEIVGLLFEYMLNDQQLPDSIKTLLSYLHTPFLKIAVTDQKFFTHPEHPARQLLNSMVAAGERWVEPSGKHKNDVFHKIKSVVQQLLNDYDSDIKLFSELAFDFNHYLRQHARRIKLAEKRAMQAAQGENKLKEIRLKVNRYLNKKVGMIKLHPLIKNLLFEPWANFLSFNLLRFGSSSEQWKEAAQAVDDILWYSQSHSEHDWHARKRVQELKATLPVLLTKGFETVGYDSTQGHRLLKLLHQQQENILATTTAAPAPIEANIDEVDLTWQTEKPLENDNIIKQLKKVEHGTWFEFYAKSQKPYRAKLAWSNTTTLHFMFVNRMGKQISVKTGEELATEIRNRDTIALTPLEAKPFFEKAMERVLEQMRQREQKKPN
jgi:hypothetical protein